VNENQGGQLCVNTVLKVGKLGHVAKEIGEGRRAFRRDDAKELFPFGGCLCFPQGAGCWEGKFQVGIGD
jgi:hypothetical protein